MVFYISDLEGMFGKLCDELKTYHLQKLKKMFGSKSDTIFNDIFVHWNAYKSYINERAKEISKHTFSIKLGSFGMIAPVRYEVPEMIKRYGALTFEIFVYEWMNIFDLLVHCAYYIGIPEQIGPPLPIKQFINTWWSIRETLLYLWNNSFGNTVDSHTASRQHSNKHPTGDIDTVSALFEQNSKAASRHVAGAGNKPEGTGYPIYPNDVAGTTTRDATEPQVAAVHSSRSGSSTSSPVFKSLASLEVTVGPGTAVAVSETRSKREDALPNRAKISGERQRSTEEEHAVSGMSEESAGRVEQKLERLSKSLEKSIAENEALKKQLTKEQDEREQVEKAALSDRRNADMLQKLLKEEQEGRRELERKLRDAEKARGNAMDQLAANMDREISRDEQNYENINIRNRPLKIIEEFEGLCSQEWLTAKQEIDELVDSGLIPDLSEKERCLFLCEVLETCYANATRVLNSILTENARQFSDNVVAHSKKPLLKQPTWRGSSSPEVTEITVEELVVPVKKVLKAQAHEADFNDLPRAKLKELVNRKGLPAQIYRNSHIGTYAKEGMKLCWKMVLQHPPMTIDCNSLIGKPIDDKLAEPHYGSANPKDPRSRVDYYVNPGVFHGKRLMNKARVFLVMEADQRMENLSLRSTDVQGGGTASDPHTRRPDGGVNPGATAVAADQHFLPAHGVRYPPAHYPRENYYYN